MSLLAATGRVSSAMALLVVAMAVASGPAYAASAAAPAPAAKAAGQAPKPARLSDGRPNWTGFWTPIGGLMDRNFGPGAVASAPAATNGAQTPPPPHAPLRSPYKEKYEATLAESARGVVTFDPTALCLPPGMPRMMKATYGIELLQTAGQVTITSEWQAASRRIWTDGRKHPPEDELLPSYAGHSIGRWEGDTLVVDTVGVRDDVLIDQSGLPISTKLRITERIRQTEPGLLVDEITIDDPLVFTAPWTMRNRYRYRPDLDLQEYVCLENNRNVGANGEPEFK